MRKIKQNWLMEFMMGSSLLWFYFQKYYFFGLKKIFLLFGFQTELRFKQFKAGSKRFISKDKNVHFYKDNSWFVIEPNQNFLLIFVFCKFLRYSSLFLFIFEIIWIFVGAEINLFRHNTVIRFPYFILWVNCFIF